MPATNFRFSGSNLAGMSLRSQFLPKPIFRPAALLMLLALFMAGCSTVQTLDITAPPPAAPAASAGKYAAIVVDVSSGRTLFNANSEAPRYPASLTKMMTLYMLFEAMESGRISKTTQIPVSAYAASRPPTKMGLRPGETIDVESAILALVTKSANDIAVAIGEFLAGSEEAFAAAMTARARQIGMRGTVFRNASGLPDDGQVTTARDMAVLGMRLRQRFPQHYHYFSNRSFAFRGRTIRGHNDLIGRVAGVDGIKTGYIRASGFNIATSVDLDGQRLVVVVMGGDSARARNQHVEELIARYLPQAARRGYGATPVPSIASAWGGPN